MFYYEKYEFLYSYNDKINVQFDPHMFFTLSILVEFTLSVER
ncbi:MAG TPA: hypothetical protein PLA88_06670 [Bacteroidales bacterium]|nr:hypothetical protein [Bacteroidales bacterium]